MTDTQNRDELVRLAGEQALLSRELRNLNADQQRDLLALRNLPTDMVLKTDWHAKGTTLLDRLRDRQQQMAIGHQRLAELAKLTGITRGRHPRQPLPPPTQKSPQGLHPAGFIHESSDLC